MITRSEQRHAQQRALEYLDRAGVVMTAEEREQIEVSDFGLSKLEYFGCSDTYILQHRSYLCQTDSPISQPDLPRALAS